jgi:hypothetical protein
MKKLLIFLFIAVSCSLATPEKINIIETGSFLQISNNGSGVDDDGLENDSKLISLILLTIIGSIVSCAGLQGIIILSKRMNSEMIQLRKNYKQYKGLLKFREFRNTYNQEREVLKSI